MSVYLDYNASAPIDERVLTKMVDVYRNCIGNPDSRTHVYGENAREIVETARKQVASLLSVDSTDVYFTSGATESNNIAIQGLVQYGNKTGKKHIITTSIEHKAVLETVKHLEQLGFSVDYISPDETGRIKAEQVISRINENTLLVSIMHVNNETGIIQPVDEIGKAIKDSGVLFHVDATQSCGKLVEELRHLNYDMLSFSAHKFCGPQGVGALILRRRNGKRLPVSPIMFGGQQEKGIRPGTVPVALVAGCGEACSIAAAEYKEVESHSYSIKRAIVKLLEESRLNYQIIGDQEHCLSSTINISIDGISSEALMLNTKEFCSISNGSACTSKNYSLSYVLLAMGLSESCIRGAIRISWGPNTSLDDTIKELGQLLSVAYDMIN